MSRVPTIGPDPEVAARFAWVRNNLPSGFLTQTGVAHKMGCSLSHYSKIEAAMVPCSEDFAQKFCARLGVNFQWLIGGAGDPWGPANGSATPGQATPVAESAGQSGIGAGHGRNEVCRLLVQAAVRETKAALGDKGTMASIHQLSRHMGKTEDDVLALVVWDKVKDVPQQ